MLAFLVTVNYEAVCSLFNLLNQSNSGFQKIIFTN